MEPSPPLGARLSALPFFVNNLAPALRRSWIEVSRRATVAQHLTTDLPILAPQDLGLTGAAAREEPPTGSVSVESDVVSEPAARAVGQPARLPQAVVLHDRVLIGVLEGSSPADAVPTQAASDISSASDRTFNPAPQTIRPDMTLDLAAALLRHSAYLLVTDSDGCYLGLYKPS